MRRLLFILVPTGKLSLVAEHFIETYFQLGDTGLLFQLGFQLGKEALAAVHDIPQLVHFGVEQMCIRDRYRLAQTDCLSASAQSPDGGPR